MTEPFSLQLSQRSEWLGQVETSELLVRQGVS
jgi:hypothetical protein